MSRTARLLLVSFLESFATICVERGIYFFTEDALAFGNEANLWLALSFGVPYVFGALLSHAAAARWGDRRLLLLTISGQCAIHVAMAARPLAAAIFTANAALGLLNGLKWPVLESFVNAGLTPAQTARAVGRFNVAWASAVPLSLLVSGPLMATCGGIFFLVPAAINLAGLGVALPLEQRLQHLAEDHPARPDAARMERLQNLLTASRWLLLGSYGAMWVLAALLPGVFARMEFTVGAATGLSSGMDLGRLGAFVVLQSWTRWHERIAPLACAAVCLAGGFFLVMFGAHVAAVLAAEIVFGLSTGMIYYAALYYAMVVKNAAVDAGGVHEGLIGGGFAIGPAAGLAGIWLAPHVGATALGAAPGIALLLLACAVMAARALRRVR